MRASIRQTADVSGLDWVRAIGLACAVDGANIGEFDSHRCFRRLKVLAYEEKYIERRKKSTLNAGVRRRSLSAARISSMYGRFGGLTGDISLTYGRHMRRKPQNVPPKWLFSQATCHM